MYPRGKLDIGWSDLAFGVIACARRGDAEAKRKRLESFWSSRGEAFACLSVRTGFDALLQALALPAGSEILVSALTIRDMTRIIEENGLVAVPVDLDMDTLAVQPDCLESLITDRTRAMLIAHVWGSRMPLEEIAALAHRRELLLIEDCAQAYSAISDRGHPLADVSMFSFGTIKTNTALGGAMLEVRHPALLARMRDIERAYPVQQTSTYLRRVLKYSILKALSQPFAFGLFARVCKVFGRSHDAIISHSLRGFPGPQLLAKIRRRSSAALLAMMDRRLRANCAARVAHRIAIADWAIEQMPGIVIPGSKAATHVRWTFPITCSDPDALMEAMRGAGFDATRGASSLYVVQPPLGRAEATPEHAASWMARLLYLPVSADMPAKALKRLTNAVLAFESKGREELAGQRASLASLRVEQPS